MEGGGDGGAGLGREGVTGGRGRRRRCGRRA